MNVRVHLYFPARMHYDKFLKTNQGKSPFWEKLLTRHEGHRGQIDKNLCRRLLNGIGMHVMSAPVFDGGEGC